VVAPILTAHLRAEGAEQRDEDLQEADDPYRHREEQLRLSSRAAAGQASARALSRPLLQGLPSPRALNTIVSLFVLYANGS